MTSSSTNDTGGEQFSDSPACFSLRVLLDELKPGRTVFLPGATGEIFALISLLREAPERARDIRFMGCFVPGMNEFDYAGLHPSTRVSTFMLPQAMRNSFVEGRIDLIPRAYSGAAALLAQTGFDVAIAQVAMPDDTGACSLGIASDFTPLAWPRARRRILVINPLMPSMPRGPRLSLADADLVIEAESPLVTAPLATASEELDHIAKRIAELIPDGATIQTGIGGAPGAIWAHLRGHRDLVLNSGMANDGLRDLADAGVLAQAGSHRTGIAYGSDSFYRYLADSDLVEFTTTLQTHSIATLAAIDRLHAINAALEIDLFGQVNVEWRDGKITGGVGGSPDFARGAMLSPGGRSIIALPATARRGQISRILARLNAPTIGLSRAEVDTVVTEHGIAELRNKGLDDRAHALIAVADPKFRDELAVAWKAMRKIF